MRNLLLALLLTGTTGNLVAVQLSVSSLPSQCFQPDGSIFVGISNGTSPYVVALDGAEPVQIFGSTWTFVDLLSGTYAVQVTDATGAVASAEATVGELGITSAGIILDRFDCFSSCQGVGRILPSEFGGTPPYQFSHPTSSDPVYTEMIRINGLCHPYDTVRITDALGCTGEVPLFVGNFAPVPIPASDIQPACESEVDGSITITWGALQVTSFRIEGPTLDSVVTGVSSPYTFEGLGTGTWTIRPWEPSDGWFCLDPEGCPRYCWQPTIVEVPEAPQPCGLTTALDEASASRPTLQLLLDQTGELLIASGFDRLNDPQVFALDGRTIMTPMRWNNGDLQVDLRQLSTGIYILHTEIGSARFAKR